MLEIGKFIAYLFTHDEKCYIELKDMYNLFIAYNIGEGWKADTILKYDAFVEALIKMKYDIRSYNSTQRLFGWKLDAQEAEKARESGPKSISTPPEERKNEKLVVIDHTYSSNESEGTVKKKSTESVTATKEVSKERLEIAKRKALEDKDYYSDEEDIDLIGNARGEIISAGMDIMCEMKRDEFLLIEERKIITAKQATTMKEKSTNPLFRYASNNSQLFDLFGLSVKLLKSDLHSKYRIDVDNLDTKNVPLSQRKKVLSTTRDAVWYKYVDRSTNMARCFCCRIFVSSDNWQCSHIIAEARGGSNTIENLRICCKRCNAEMGEMNLYVYCVSKGFPLPEE